MEARTTGGPSSPPDGQSVLFQSDRGRADWHLFRVAAAGGPVHAITDGRLNHDTVRVSTTGKELAFTAGGGDYISFDHFTMPLEGGSAQRLTSFGKVRFPVWCGGTLVYQHRRRDVSLWLIDMPELPW